NVEALSFSRGGRMLAVGTDQGWRASVLSGVRGRGDCVLLLDVGGETPRERHELGVSTGKVLSVALSPDGRRLAVGGASGVELWDLEGRKSGVLQFLLAASYGLAAGLGLLGVAAFFGSRFAGRRWRACRRHRDTLRIAARYTGAALAICLVLALI